MRRRDRDSENIVYGLCSSSTVETPHCLEVDIRCSLVRRGGILCGSPFATTRSLTKTDQAVPEDPNQTHKVGTILLVDSVSTCEYQILHRTSIYMARTATNAAVLKPQGEGDIKFSPSASTRSSWVTLARPTQDQDSQSRRGSLLVRVWRY